MAAAFGATGSSASMERPDHIILPGHSKDKSLGQWKRNRIQGSKLTGLGQVSTFWASVSSPEN